MNDMNHTADGTGALLTRALSHLTNLVRKEFTLARAETTRTLQIALAGIGLVVGGVVLALTALHVLAAALVAGIATTFAISVGWSSLIVGVAFAVLAAGLVAGGAKALKPDNLMPERTVENLRKDQETLKEAI